jgi:N-acetylneuraminic acid mutarotase
MMKRYLMLVGLVACSLDNSGKNHCETQADCLDGYTCSADNTCTPTTACVPETCAVGQCGDVSDGCNGTLHCGTCPVPDHCTNGTIDPGETDVDCGGACSACLTGRSCGITSDCATGTCEGNVCLAGTWTTAAVMPTARTMVGAAVGADGLIYAIGGYTEFSTVTGVVEVYNPATNSWSTRAPMPTPRYGFAAVLGPDHKIWTIGGNYDSNLTNDGPSIKVEAYDPATNTWQTMPPLPAGRYMTAASVGSDGRIYVSGGYQHSQLYILPTVASIAPGDAQWTTLTDVLTSARDGHGSVATPDGKIYVVGGSSGSQELGSLEYHQVGMIGWNTLTPMPTPRKMTAATTSGGKIYVSGGNAWWSAGVSCSTALELYDPASSTWHRGASLPVGRFDHASVTAPDGKIYLLGGESDGDNSNTTNVVYAYTPDP